MNLKDNDVIERTVIDMRHSFITGFKGAKHVFNSQGEDETFNMVIEDLGDV
jgi:hypothetical protein